MRCKLPQMNSVKRPFIGNDMEESVTLQSEIVEAREQLAYSRQNAERAIDKVLDVIQLYESKWQI